MPQNNKFSEEEVRLILRSAVRGDRDAAVRLLQSYTNDMYFVARLYLKDVTAAKKTVQAAFNAAYTRLHEAEGEVSFEKWLHGIVREYAVKAISPLHREAPAAVYSSDDEKASEGLELPDEATCRKYLLQGFAVLTEEERMAAALRYYDHLTVSRIAVLLNAEKEDAEVWLANAKAGFERSGIIIGRILALIEKIAGEEQMEEPVYSPRHASQDVGFPDDPEQQEETIENTSFRRFTDLSHEPLPEVPAGSAENKENGQEQTQDTIVLPRMPEMPKPAVKPVPVPAEEKKEPEPQNDHEDEEEDDDEDGNPMITNIIIGVSLAVLLASGIFFLYQLKPDLFSWLPFAKQPETAQVETETSAPLPSASAEATAAPSEPAAENTSLGTVTIEADTLNVRDSASMNGNPVSKVSKGEQYDVLETSFDGTQNWYRIGDGQWVTDANAGYLTYTPAQ